MEKEFYGFDKYANKDRYSRDELAERIAWFMMAKGSLETTEGSWIFYFDEIDQLFNTDLSNDREMAELIEEKLDTENIIFWDEDTLQEDCFDLNFMRWCAPNADEED